MGECFFWYWLTLVVPDKVQRAVIRLYVVHLRYAVFGLVHQNVAPGQPGQSLLSMIALFSVLILCGRLSSLFSPSIVDDWLQVAQWCLVQTLVYVFRVMSFYVMMLLLIIGSL